MRIIPTKLNRFLNYLEKEFLFDKIDVLCPYGFLNDIEHYRKNISDYEDKYKTLEDIYFSKSSLKDFCNFYKNPRILLCRRYQENGKINHSIIFIIENEHGIVIPLKYISKKNPDIEPYFHFCTLKANGLYSNLYDYNVRGRSKKLSKASFSQSYLFVKGQLKCFSRLGYGIESKFPMIGTNIEHNNRSLEVIIEEYNSEFLFKMYYNRKLLKTEKANVNLNLKDDELSEQIFNLAYEFTFPFNLDESDYKELGVQEKPQFTEEFVSMMNKEYRNLIEMIKI